jgi:hypothetical protein
MTATVYKPPQEAVGRNRRAFCRLRAERPTWYVELACDTAAALTAWKRPQQRQPPARRIDVRHEQGELVDALRAANPVRWSDSALAELLGIDLAAIDALMTSAEDCLPCNVA